MEQLNRTLLRVAPQRERWQEHIKERNRKQL